MKLRKLQLENFRSYSALSFQFPQEKNILIIVGLNGKGKTNFLEAIYTLSLGRSFRTLTHENLIKWENDYLRIKGEVLENEEDLELEVFFAKAPKRQKNFKKNQVNQKHSEYIGSLLTVLFHPEDLNMLYLSPSYRRRYLDILLSQTDKHYLFSLSQYRKILKQRNALLNQILKKRLNGNSTTNLEEDLDVWDQQIAEHGTIIIQKRQILTKAINEHLQDIYQKISGSNESIKVEYQTKLKEDYLKELQDARTKDIRRCKTTLGPHLDDLAFYIDNREIEKMASRGEFRTLLLAVKIAEIDYIKDKTQKNPLLLLDDVFSELDEQRQKHLIQIIREHQTIITTTHVENVQDLSEISQIVTIENLG